MCHTPRMLAPRTGATPAIALTLLLVIASAGCSAPGEESPSGGRAPQSETPVAGAPVGPLCDQLPQGTEPGGPPSLATMTAEEALTWIPVLTVFEAGVRAAGLDGDLAASDGVTILAPTDTAFNDALTEETLDELILLRQDELRALLESHLVEGTRSLADLLDAGEVTSLGGTRITVAPEERGMVRLDDRARTRCADYRTANARIHVIDGVLGELPSPAPEEPETG